MNVSDRLAAIETRARKVDDAARNPNVSHETWHVVAAKSSRDVPALVAALRAVLDAADAADAEAQGFQERDPGLAARLRSVETARLRRGIEAQMTRQHSAPVSHSVSYRIAADKLEADGQPAIHEDDGYSAAIHDLKTWAEEAEG